MNQFLNIFAKPNCNAMNANKVRLPSEKMQRYSGRRKSGL